jgi:hypothetical protein
MPVVYHRLPKIAAGAVPIVEKAVAKTAFDTEALAKFNAPVDTGNLRASIGAQPVRPLTWRVSANADYALYVEVGARGRSGVWFLTNALRQSWGELNRAIGKGLLG